MGISTNGALISPFKNKDMKNEITKGTKLQSINNKNLVVIFKSYVGTNKTEFRTIDDFQFRLDEFIIID